MWEGLGEHTAGNTKAGAASGGTRDPRLWVPWMYPPSCYSGDTTGISPTAWFEATYVLSFCRLSLHTVGTLATSSVQFHILTIPRAWRTWVFSLSDPTWKILRKNCDWCTLGHLDPIPGPRTGPRGTRGWAKEGAWLEYRQRGRCPPGRPLLLEEIRPTLRSALRIGVPVK